MKKFGIVILSLLIVSGIFLALSQMRLSPPNTADKKIQVTASFYPLYFFAHEIGADKADVANLTPAGAEPHDYEPTPQDVARIETSNLLILNGGKLEAWGERIGSTIDTKRLTIITAGADLTTQSMEENGQQIIDPHVWLSPKLAQKEVDRILAGFLVADPTNKDFYRKNATILTHELQDLDTKYQKGLSQCMSTDIVTSHAAFGYLARDYGLHQLPIAGLSPDEEPSSQQLAQVVRFANSHHVTTIFFENRVSPKLSETIATEVGADTAVLEPLEGVSETDMKSGKNYFTIMEDNLSSLRTDLSCM